MPRHARPNRAMALATAILVSMILLVLGLSFLYFLERDYRFAGAQERSQEAYYLALAGLQYTRARPDLFPINSSQTIQVPLSDSYHYFTVTVDSTGTIRSRGVVWSGIAVVAERTLVVSANKSPSTYLDQSL